MLEKNKYTQKALLSRDLMESMARIKRFANNTQTKVDESIVQSFACGSDTWYQAAQKNYISIQNRLDDFESEKKSREDFILSEGMMFSLYKSQGALPNCLLRSALFTSKVRKKREYINKLEIPSIGDGKKIQYSGLRLDQSDMDVLLGLINLLSLHSDEGTVSRIRTEYGEAEYSRIKITRYKLLKIIKRNTQSSQYKWLFGVLNRLTGELSLDEGSGLVCSGPILAKRSLDKYTDQLVIDINIDFLKLFSYGYTYINLDERMSLPSGFPKWLSAYTLSHRGQSSLSAQKMMDLSGCNYTRINDFVRKTATPAFDLLQSSGQIKSYKLFGQLYRWTR